MLHFNKRQGCHLNVNPLAIIYIISILLNENYIRNQFISL